MADELKDTKIKQVKEKAEAKPAKSETKPPAEEAKAISESPKKEKAKEKPAKVKISKKMADLISQIEQLSVLDLADLVKALEEKFGVTPMAAGAPVTAATTGTGAGAPAGGESGISEQTTFNVVLASPGANKISAIKIVREINQTLGLKEAKDLVESTPKEILTGVNKSTAEEAKKKLEGVGATVELK